MMDARESGKTAGISCPLQKHPRQAKRQMWLYGCRPLQVLSEALSMESHTASLLAGPFLGTKPLPWQTLHQVMGTGSRRRTASTSEEPTLSEEAGLGAAHTGKGCGARHQGHMC